MLVAGDSDLNTGLAGALFTHLKTLSGANASGTNSEMAKFCNALAAAIVPYITSNAVVLPTGIPPMVAGTNPVTGTGVIT